MKIRRGNAASRGGWRRFQGILRAWSHRRHRWIQRLARAWHPVVGWWRSRRIRYFLIGLPSVAAIGGLATVSIAGHRARRDILPRYERALTSAMASRDHRLAVLLCDRVLQDSPDRQDIEYQRAIALYRMGNQEYAESLFRRLAPEDRLGYYKAHYRLAAQLLAGRTTKPQQEELAVNHLLRAIEEDNPNLGQAHMLLGAVLQGQGRFEKAEKHFTKAVSYNEEWRFQLASLYKVWSLDRQEAEPKKAAALMERCRAEAELVRASTSRQLSVDPADHDARRKLAACVMLVDQYQVAVNLLQDGQALFDGTQRRAYRKLLALAYYDWARHAAERPKASTARRLILLRRSLAFDPSYRPALIALIEITDKAGAREELQKLLIGGKAPPATLHLLLGNSSWERGNHEQARRHWEQALRLGGPSVSLLTRNLAWALANHDPPRSEQAVEMVSSCADRSPDSWQIRLTRGRILAGMKRWRLATTDLEFAVPSLTPANQEVIHRQLAQAYRELKDDDNAARHAAIADKLRAGTGK